MIVLGFDAATRATAVGLLLEDGTTLHDRDDPDESEHPGHATRLLGMAAQLLDRAGIGWGELERVAVGVGPGRFTGLRVGIATARGLAQSLGVDLVGVSSLQALAHRTRAEDRPVLAAIDARRGEVFAAAYVAGEELAGPRALRPEDLGAAMATAPGPWLAIGDGAVCYRADMRAQGAEVPDDRSPLHRVDGGAICEIALRRPAEALDAVLPDYLRQPDAEAALKLAATRAQPASVAAARSGR